MVTLLIVEDDEMIRLLTKTKLSPHYHILEAGNGEEALSVYENNHVDLMIVDVMMPKMNGYELLRSLRQIGDMTPAIMLTAMNTFAHKKEGFAAGVDDYMTKPIDYEELIWRIEAILRRSKIANENRITIGKFSMDRDSCTVNYDGKDIPLTAKEFSLLYKFLSYPRVVFTKQQLLDDVWGYDTETDYDSIKTYVSRLRNKFSACDEFELTAIRGLGYKAVIHESGGKK